jgi:hypothetical protein
MLRPNPASPPFWELEKVGKALPTGAGGALDADVESFLLTGPGRFGLTRLRNH